MDKKYKFTGETKEYDGHTLREIQYVKDGERFEKNQLGGWIESEDNLSHEGECCVMQNSKVFGHARILENARTREESIIKDNAQIKGQSDIFGEAIVGADTIVAGNSKIRGTSVVFFYANSSEQTFNTPNVFGDSIIFDCKIEATGFIKSCVIKKLDEISGLLKMG